MLYIYAKPNQMVGHEYSDDVAIVIALNKKQALKKLSVYYDVTIDDIESCSLFRLFRVRVLTDY